MFFQLKTQNIIEDDINYIENLKNNILVSKQKLQTYKAVSLFFISALAFCLFLVYNKQRKKALTFKKLEHHLNAKKIKQNQLKDNVVAINNFESNLGNRLEVLLQLIVSVKNDLNQSQKKIDEEIDAIADFTRASINHYHKVKEQIHLLN